jgi:phospholipid/cholesterol/gamma-HCH transport system substrate-binding protein
VETRAKYTLVGTVIIGVIGFFVGVMIWLSSDEDENELDYYTIYFREFSLSGLQENSPVTMRGIKVGSVEALSISPKDIELVKVVIRVQRTTPVKTDTEAVVERNLLTGLAGIDLTNSSQDAPALIESPNEEFPVIPEGRTTLGAIQDNLPQLVDKTGQALSRLNGVLSPENEKAITDSLKNIQEVTQVVASRKEDIARALENFDSFMKRLENFATELDARSKEVAHSFVKTSEVVSLEVSRAGRSLGSAADSIAKTLEGYENPRALIRGPSESARGPGEGKR